jgi:ABC-2 type transport system ATP-binding protein
VIEVKDLQKSYESGLVNDRISLFIPQGSIFGLLGPNGAGKTTLIRMLATITKPDCGTILFNGEPLELKHARHMGYMPEERGLYKKMSVWDQLLFFAEIKGVAKNQARQRAKYWLERLEISEWKNKKMEELSKGMAQKVQFLCTIIHEPKFLILDEPFSGFDPVNAE